MTYYFIYFFLTHSSSPIFIFLLGFFHPSYFSQTTVHPHCLVFAYWRVCHSYWLYPTVYSGLSPSAPSTRPRSSSSYQYWRSGSTSGHPLNVFCCGRPSWCNRPSRSSWWTRPFLCPPKLGRGCSPSSHRCCRWGVEGSPWASCARVGWRWTPDWVSWGSTLFFWCRAGNRFCPLAHFHFRYWWLLMAWWFCPMNLTNTQRSLKMLFILS